MKFAPPAGILKKLKKAIFSFIPLIILICLLEVIFRLAGIADPARKPDPFAGFIKSDFQVFEPRIVEGREVFQTSESGIAQRFHAQEFERHKRDKTYRIFVLGESTVWGEGVWGVKNAFPKWIAKYFAFMYPEWNFEVINAGLPGYGSTRIRILLEEIVDYHPDLIVIMMGHNEFMERRFWIVEKMQDATVLRMQLLLSHSRIYLFLSDMVLALKDKLSPRNEQKEDVLDAKKLDRLRRAVELSKENLNEVPEDFDLEKKINMIGWESNLNSIIGYLKQKNIDLVLSAPGSNLLTPPVVFNMPESISEKDRETFNALVLDAGRELDEENASAAADLLKRASNIDPGNPWIDFLHGKICLRSGETGKAGEYLRDALEKDQKAHRMKPSFRVVMGEIAKRNGVPFLDIEEIFLRHSDYFGPLAGNAFTDHCHPNFEGHKLMGWELARFIGSIWKLPKWRDDQIDRCTPSSLPKCISEELLPHPAN
jgi:lysophospholipase L1-like esterase